jgi:hypothetical protein
MYNIFPDNFSKIIERGMLSAFTQQFEYREWVKKIEASGFTIQKVHPLVSKDFVPFWCIGIRPIAPPLVKLVNSLRGYDVAKVQEIKAEWIQLFCELAKPFLVSQDKPEDSATYLFELSK